MKILHVSDLHSQTAWFNWLIEEAPTYDLICLTGDILNLGDLSSEIDKEIDAALTHLAQIKTPLALCSGNHDLHYLSGQDRAQWMRALRRKNVWLDGDLRRRAQTAAQRGSILSTLQAAWGRAVLH